MIKRLLKFNIEKESTEIISIVERRMQELGKSLEEMTIDEFDFFFKYLFLIYSKDIVSEVYSFISTYIDNIIKDGSYDSSVNLCKFVDLQKTYDKVMRPKVRILNREQFLVILDKDISDVTDKDRLFCLLVFFNVLRDYSWDSKYYSKLMTLDILNLQERRLRRNKTFQRLYKKYRNTITGDIIFTKSLEETLTISVKKIFGSSMTVKTLYRNGVISALQVLGSNINIENLSDYLERVGFADKEREIEKILTIWGC